MPFYIELPPSGPLKTHEFKNPAEADRILAEIFNGRRFEEGMYGEVWIAGDANCYNEPWPMNQFVAGIAGTAVMTNRGPGFSSGDIARVCAHVSRGRMTAEEAETHRPPEITMETKKNDKGFRVHVHIHGTSTPQGMLSVTAFVDSIRAMVAENGATMEVHQHP